MDIQDYPPEKLKIIRKIIIFVQGFEIYLINCHIHYFWKKQSHLQFRIDYKHWMFVEKNYFERQTDFLGNVKIRQQIESTYLVSSLIVNYQYQKALQLIENCRKELEFDQQGLNYQFQLMQAFCRYQLKDLDQTKKICLDVYGQLQKQENQLLQKSHDSKQEDSKSRSNLVLELKRSFSVRFYTFVISICVQGQNIGIQPAEVLERLIKILKVDKCIYLPQVLGTLTGCKNFKEVQKIKFLRGSENAKKAIKLQFLATWKYLIDQKDQCIKFKKEALKIWKNQNLLNQKEKCEEQLRQLMEGISSSKNTGKFMKKLGRLNFFVFKLRALEKQASYSPKHMNIKWSFPVLIDSLRAAQQQQKSQKNLSQSKFVKTSQKKNHLEEIINKTQTFYSNYKKQINSQVTGLIFNSKFIDERKKQIRTKVGKFLKLKKCAFFIAFPEIKRCAQARYKRSKINK